MKSVRVNKMRSRVIHDAERCNPKPASHRGAEPCRLCVRAVVEGEGFRNSKNCGFTLLA